MAGKLGVPPKQEKQGQAPEPGAEGRGKGGR